MARWGMLIDLQRCITCYACVIACKQEHFLPPGIHFNRVIIGEKGTDPSVMKTFYPLLCNHCEDAPCVKVCPTGATQKRFDGIVVVDAEKCVGCRYCVIVCPYQARSYCSTNGADREWFPNQGLTELEAIGSDLYPIKEKTVVKCNFCAERIDSGMAKRLTPGIDREATPACVITCPANARVFGDLDDPNSEISRVAKEKRAHGLKPEFGTEPNVLYVHR